MLDFVLDLTKRQQISFMTLEGNIFKSFVKPTLMNPNINIYFPTTIKEADSFLLSRVNSMYQNFLVEDVSIVFRYACISLSQKLDHAMAHETNYHFIVDKNGNCGNGGMNNYPTSRQLEERLKRYVDGCRGKVAATAIGWIILWSDSFVVHWTKQYDNGMWIFTATVCPKPEVIPKHPD